jgi:DNA-binding NarL/FixJ family response regulator
MEIGKLIVILLFLNLIVIGIFYWRLIKRYSKFSLNDEEEKKESYQKMLQLITEFNKASNTNIEILEDKISELRVEIENAEKLISNLRKIKEERVEEDKEKLEDLKEDLQDRYQRVNDLIKEGLSIDEVAKRVKISKGEIKLVSNLRKV